jgi:hypothetical protein
MAFANASSLVLATSCAGSPAGGGAAAACPKADEQNTDNATAAMRTAVRCILGFTS